MTDMEPIPVPNEVSQEYQEFIQATAEALLYVQISVVLQIAAEIATTNTTIRDLHIEFAEKIRDGEYDVYAMIDELEYWKPGSRQRVAEAVDQMFHEVYEELNAAIDDHLSMPEPDHR